YLEGELPAMDRVDFEEHLRLCPGCDTYLDQFRTTISLMGQLSAESISSDARTRLLDAFADWRGPATSGGGG
ncbi:MAG: anti-sigma factor family protein, partial [Ornithinibacter sp.]